MLKQQTTELGDITLTVTQHPPRQALALMPRVARVFGPALSHLAEVGAKYGITSDAAIDAELEAKIAPIVMPMLLEVFAAMPDGELDSLVGELLRCSTAFYPPQEGAKRCRAELGESKGKEIDVVFAGNLLALVEAAWFSVKVNFADFIAGARKQLATLRASRAAAAAKDQPPSPST